MAAKCGCRWSFQPSFSTNLGIKGPCWGPQYGSSSAGCRDILDIKIVWKSIGVLFFKAKIKISTPNKMQIASGKWVYIIQHDWALVNLWDSRSFVLHKNRLICIMSEGKIMLWFLKWFLFLISVGFFSFSFNWSWEE